MNYENLTARSVSFGALFLSAASCRAQTEKNAPLLESERVRLSQLQARLQPLLKFGEETVPLQWEGSALVVRFRTREFMVYAERWPGEYETQSHSEVGPQHDGWILRLELKSGSFESNENLPVEKRGPYWLLRKDAVPLNVLNLNYKAPPTIQTPQNPQEPTEVDEYPDVPRGHWAYDALEQLVRDGIIEGSIYRNGTFRIMTRYEFAVAVARLSEGLGLNEGKESAYFTKLKPETRVLIEKLRREFSSNLMRLGVKLSLNLPYYHGAPNVLPQHLLVEMRYNYRTDNLRGQIQDVINQWALDDTKEQLQIKEDK